MNPGKRSRRRSAPQVSEGSRIRGIPERCRGTLQPLRHLTFNFSAIPQENRQSFRIAPKEHQKNTGFRKSKT